MAMKAETQDPTNWSPPIHEGGPTGTMSSYSNPNLSKETRIQACPKPPKQAKGNQKGSDSLVGTLCNAFLNHQIGISVNLLLLLFLTHIFFPRARRRTRKFFELSYHDQSTGQYTQGWDDFPYVFFWVVIFTGLRAFALDYVFTPCAKLMGVQKKKASIRFAEQAWMLLYYITFWPLGMYIMYNSNYWFNLQEMWTNFPTRTIDPLLKWYYLAQAGFWLQQIIVLNIEEKRKDHWQMFTHHIITCTLIYMSYGYYQTKVGNVILCIMDLVDVILPFAKLLKYMNYQTACDTSFGLFILSWVATRHVFYPMVCWSIYADVPKIMPTGCYSSATGQKLPPSPEFPADGGQEILRHVFQAFRDPGGVVCFNERIRWAFFTLLMALQVLMVLWFTLIVKLVIKVLKGGNADDIRSDDEGEEESGTNEALPSLDTADMTTLNLPLQEEEVGVDALRFHRKASPGTKQYRRHAGRASGISIPGHSDHKELLGRIGCDKTS